MAYSNRQVNFEARQKRALDEKLQFVNACNIDCSKFIATDSVTGNVTVNPSIYYYLKPFISAIRPQAEIQVLDGALKSAGNPVNPAWIEDRLKVFAIVRKYKSNRWYSTTAIKLHNELAEKNKAQFAVYDFAECLYYQKRNYVNESCVTFQSVDPRMSRKSVKEIAAVKEIDVKAILGRMNSPLNTSALTVSPPVVSPVVSPNEDRIDKLEKTLLAFIDKMSG
jgi:hypothetical protein